MAAVHPTLDDAAPMQDSAARDRLRVEFPGRGTRAVAFAAEKPPDVAVLGIAMPGLDGVEAARRIHDLCPDTHILMLSSEVGALLGLSPKSIDTYCSRMMRKLDIEDLTSLVKFAIRHCVTSVE